MVVRPFDKDTEEQLARWNHNFTFVTVVHGAFLGAFLSKIDYRADWVGYLASFSAVILLTFALFEMHGVGWTRIRNAIVRRHNRKDYRLFEIVAFTLFPLPILFVGDQKQPSHIYMYYVTIITLSWFITSSAISSFIAKELKANAPGN